MATNKPPRVGNVNPSTNPQASGPPAPGSSNASGGLNLGAPPPPPTKKGKGTAYQKFAKWAAAHGVAGATSQDIWYWSRHSPNVDPYLWTSVLLAESGAKHMDGNGHLVSSGQAVGIGQIAVSWVGQPIPWNKNKKFTGDNDPQTGIGNYGVNLRMSAYLWGDAVARNGWQKAYTEGYNPNDPHKQQAWAAISKTYSSRPAGVAPPNAPSQGPADTSAANVSGTSVDTVPFSDLFVVGVDKQGKFVLTKDPNKALQYDGAPLTRSSFLSLRDQLTSHFVSYTGQRPSNKQIETFLYGGKKGKPGVTPQNATAWSTYQLDTLLSKGKNFKKSPIYKERAVQLNAAVKDYLPDGGKVPDEMMRQAVINQWDAQTLASRLQKQPGYLKSNQFKGDVASLMNVYTTIMGNPAQGSQEAMTSVRDAALAGWDTNQFASYLRGHPQYKHSTEYQSKTLDFLSSLGLVTGARPIMAKGLSNPGPGAVGPNTQGQIPTDKRVAGNPNNSYAPLPELNGTLG